jgi:hypothetical protein
MRGEIPPLTGVVQDPGHSRLAGWPKSSKTRKFEARVPQQLAQSALATAPISTLFEILSLLSCPFSVKSLCNRPPADIFSLLSHPSLAALLFATDDLRVIAEPL